VATPGRLIAHLEKGSLKLNNTAALVLDEVDVLAGTAWHVWLGMVVRCCSVFLHVHLHMNSYTGPYDSCNFLQGTSFCTASVIQLSVYLFL